MTGFIVVGSSFSSSITQPQFVYRDHSVPYNHLSICHHDIYGILGNFDLGVDNAKIATM